MSTNVIDSLLQQKTPSEIPTIAATPTYLMMARDRGVDVLNMSLKTNINSNSPLGSWSPVITAGNQLADNISVSGLLVNSLPFYAILGKADLAGGNYVVNSRRDISNMTLTEGVKPTYALNEVIGTVQHTVYGAMFDTLSLNYDGGFLKAALSGQGRSQTIGDTPSGSTYPSAVQSKFNLQTHYKWNAAAIENILSVECTMKQGSNLSIGKEGFIEDISDNNPIFTNFTISFIGEQLAIFTDDFNKTKRDILWRMDKSQDPTHFFEISAPDSLCNEIRYVKEKGKIIGGAATFTSAAVSVDILDGLNDSFLTIPV